MERTLLRNGQLVRLSEGARYMAGWELEKARKATAMWILALMLFGQRGKLVTREDIFEALWGADEDGGPLTADKVYHRQVHYLRKRIEVIGFSIKVDWGLGYHLEEVLE